MDLLALGRRGSIAVDVTGPEGVLVLVIVVVGRLDVEESVVLGLMAWNESLRCQREGDCLCDEEVGLATVVGKRRDCWG